MSPARQAELNFQPYSMSAKRKRAGSAGSDGRDASPFWAKRTSSTGEVMFSANITSPTQSPFPDRNPHDDRYGSMRSARALLPLLPHPATVYGRLTPVLCIYSACAPAGPRLRGEIACAHPPLEAAPSRASGPPRQATLCRRQ